MYTEHTDMDVRHISFNICNMGHAKYMCRSHMYICTSSDGYMIHLDKTLYLILGPPLQMMNVLGIDGKVPWDPKGERGRSAPFPSP